jgi:signal transduction histidine kinase
VDCRAVVEEVVATLSPEAARKTLSFASDLPLTPVLLRTDRRAVSQILINLVGNAIKFTQNGKVHLTLQDDLLRAGGRTVLVCVSDTGPGIPAEDQARLFEAFSRVESADRRHQEGTGLGLHLSRKLAEALGGRIHFESTDEQGSTFILELPEPRE